MDPKAFPKHGKETTLLPLEAPSVETVLESFSLPVLLVDLERTCLIYANRAARTASLAAFNFRDLKFPFYPAVQGETVSSEEYQHQTPEGHATYLVHFGLLAFPGQPRPIATLSFVDISAAKRTEEELRQAVKDRDDFFSLATHELKDPLFSLQLSIDLLHHRVEKEGQISTQALHKHLDVSRRQTAHLSRLVENLLAVSRIQDKGFHLDLEEVDLCAMVHEVTGRFQDLSSRAGIPLKAEPCQTLVGSWDRNKMEQILSNLLSNAIKYGAGRPVTIRIHNRESAAVMEVQDQGIGIAPEDQARIFNRFERVPTTQVKESLGLGLFIVRSLVEAHGGTIALRSEMGKGSLFTITLPRSQPLI